MGKIKRFIKFMNKNAWFLCKIYRGPKPIHTNKCREHKWNPAFIEGWCGDTHVKFIGAYCEKCRLGYDELHYTAGKMTEVAYATYSEKYFYGTELPNKETVLYKKIK